MTLEKPLCPREWNRIVCSSCSLCWVNLPLKVNQEGFSWEETKGFILWNKHWGRCIGRQEQMTMVSKEFLLSLKQSPKCLEMSNYFEICSFCLANNMILQTVWSAYQRKQKMGIRQRQGDLFQSVTLIAIHIMYLCFSEHKLEASLLEKDETNQGPIAHLYWEYNGFHICQLLHN